MTKNEVLVKALLDFNEELTEKMFTGKWHLADELIDLWTAVREAELTDKQRSALRMVFFDRMEQNDVAQELGTTQQNVSLHVNAAIRNVAKIYDMWEELEDDE